MIVARCECGRAFELPDMAAGKRGKCPECGAKVTIPAPPPVDQTVEPASEPIRRRGKNPPRLKQAADRGLLPVAIALLLGSIVAGLVGWAIGRSHPAGSGEATAADLADAQRERDRLGAELQQLRDASNPTDAARLLADAQLKIRDLQQKITEANRREEAAQAAATQIAATAPGRLLESVREPGVKKVTTEMVEVERKVLGVRSGGHAKFPHLPGEVGLGLSRQQVVEALEKLLDRELVAVDKSNGAAGELHIIRVAGLLDVSLFGSWHNLHAVRVSMLAEKLDAIDNDAWAEISGAVASLATGEYGYEDRPHAEWMLQQLADPAEDGVIRDDCLVLISKISGEGYEAIWCEVKPAGYELFGEADD